MKSTIKLLTLLVIAVLMILTLVACGGGNSGGGQVNNPPKNEPVVIVPAFAEIKDGELFAYDENGKRVTHTEVFIEINGDIYYVIDNLVVYNQYIIEDAIYNFGNDGKMYRNTTKDGYTYGDDGKLIANNIFITINGDVYFVVNNVIVCNQMIVINGAIYSFDNEGKRVTGEKDGYTYNREGKLLADNVFITINGDVYYIINNTVVYNKIIIDGAVYDFGDDGKMVTGEKDGYTYGEDGKLIANNVFITINGDVYFIVNNVIIYNQIVIDGAVYDFGDDGKMVTGEKDGNTYGSDGKLVGHYIFITINGDVYFIMNNTVVYNQIVINGSIYDFGDDGKMVRNTVKDGYTYNFFGKLEGHQITITINGELWLMYNNIAYSIYGDCDGDGLSNKKEIELGTNYFNSDTDEDGAWDGKEIEMGFDPTIFNASFNVTYVPVIDNEDKKDTVTPTINIEIKGAQMNSIKVERNDFFDEDTLGYIGDAYKYSIDAEINGATVGFEINLDMLASNALPTIYKYNEDTNQMVPLDTTINGNKATAEVDELSTFVILDRRVYEEELEWVDIWGLDGETYTDIEIVFVVDDSGSMSWNDESNVRLTVARDLIDKLPDGSKMGIVHFTSSTKLLTTSLVTDKSVAKNYLTTTYFRSSGGTSMYDAVQRGVGLFSTAVEGDGIMRVMVVLSDGETDDTGRASATVTMLNNAKIAAYTVGLGTSTSYFNSYMKPLAHNTGGEFYLASNASGLSGIFDDIGEKIDLTTDTDGDGLLDYYEDNMVIFNGTKYEPDKTKADTDGDGLLDGEEIRTVVIISFDNTKMSVIGKIYSDPTRADSDGDGVEDKYDAEPLNANVR